MKNRLFAIAPALSRNELARMISEAIARLADHHRDAVLFADVLGYAPEQARGILKISRNEFENRLVEGRRQLEKYLNSKGAG
jgi:DNA-directed RNA polymerase specialized sigma24 family protein